MESKSCWFHSKEKFEKQQQKVFLKKRTFQRNSTKETMDEEDVRKKMFLPNGSQTEQELQ
jgi:hypothetical protein